MAKRKAIMEELDRTWKIVDVLKEAQTVSPQAAPAQGQRAPQQPAQPGQAQQPAQPQAQPQAQPNMQVINTNMDQGLSLLMQKLPAILKTFTTTAGDKDGQLDIAGQPNTQQPQANNQAQGQRAPQQAAQPGQAGQQQPIKEDKERELFFDESKFNSEVGGMNEGGVIGLVVSAPAILQLGGKLLQKMGSKQNPNMIQKFGGVIAKTGEHLHHKYVGTIENILKTFMPNADKETLHKAAEGLYMTLVSTLLAGSIASPDALSAVKGKELADYVSKVAPALMSTLGFS